jgi:CheY-like chemotaxis protein
VTSIGGRILLLELAGAAADALRDRVQTLGHTVVGFAGGCHEVEQIAPRLAPDVVLLGASLAPQLVDSHALVELREKVDCPCVVEDAQPTIAVRDQLLQLRLQLALRDRTLQVERARTEHAEETNRATARLVHEVNNLLSAIRCNAFLINSEPVVRSVLEAANDITTAVERCAGLIQDLASMLREQRLSAPPPSNSSSSLPPPSSRRHGMPWPARGRDGRDGRDSARAMHIVLVVDDDPVVRRAVARFVSSAGYQVIESSTPEQGLAAAERYPVDLVITDLVMPNMTGFELAKRVAELRPGVRVIYMSGFGPEEFVSERNHAPGPDPIFLQKPFAVDTLMPSVVAMLAEDKSRLPASSTVVSNKQ